ncbi:hypothetical protein MTO96_002488 [Rhipicephalus appendiculatus]
MTTRDYVLHYQAEGGDWQQKAISTSSNKFTLEGLKCGSLYSFYMTATNSLGTAEPRDIIYGRTRGAGPLPPAGQPQQQQSWKLVSDVIPGHQRHFELRHLSPGREYEVRVSAHSDAGTTEADYSIRTLNRSHMAGVSSTHGSSGVQAGEGSDVPLYRNLSILLPVSVSVLVLIVVIALVMVCFRRQNDAYSAASAADENHMDDPLRKCQGSTDSMSMTEFCAKKERLQQQDAYGKATSYYAFASPETRSCRIGIEERAPRGGRPRVRRALRRSSGAAAAATGGRRLRCRSGDSLQGTLRRCPLRNNQAQST